MCIFHVQLEFRNISYGENIPCAPYVHKKISKFFADVSGQNGNQFKNNVNTSSVTRHNQVCHRL